MADINVAESIAFHRSHGKLATVTAVLPPGRFGALVKEGSTVQGFLEKPRGEGGWINGGYFVLSPKVIDLVDSDVTSWELEPMTRLASGNQLKAFEHHGFWQPMDTLREKILLEELWQNNEAPWKVWT